MTKEELRQIIIEDLSAGLMHFELDDSIVDRNIDRALLYSTDYFNYVSYKTVDITGVAGSSGYIDLTNFDGEGIPVITAVFPTQNITSAESALLGVGSLYISQGADVTGRLTSYANVMNKYSQMESMLGRGARLVGNRLYIDKYYKSVTLEYIPRKVEIDKIVEGSWLRWIIEYAGALSKLQLGQSRGKYVVSSNPSTINAAELIEQAVATKERLEQELEQKGILRVSR